MKRKLCTLLIVTLFILGVNSDSTTISKTAINTNGFIKTSAKDIFSDVKNDLVFHDYGSGTKLSSGSSFTIHQLDLKLLTDETAILYIWNLKNNSLEKLSDYTPKQDISYVAEFDGIYKLIAIKDNRTIIDLTPRAAVSVNVNYDTKKTNGLILLK